MNPTEPVLIGDTPSDTLYDLGCALQVLSDQDLLLAAKENTMRAPRKAAPRRADGESIPPRTASVSRAGAIVMKMAVHIGPPSVARSMMILGAFF